MEAEEVEPAVGGQEGPGTERRMQPQATWGQGEGSVARGEGTKR